MCFQTRMSRLNGSGLLRVYIRLIRTQILYTLYGSILKQLVPFQSGVRFQTAPTGLVQLSKCPTTYDNWGCPAPPSCVFDLDHCPKTDFDVRGCRVHNPKTCLDDEQECPGLFESTGCVEAPFCLSDDKNCRCPDQIYNESGCPVESGLPDPECDPATEIKCKDSESVSYTHLTLPTTPYV